MVLSFASTGTASAAGQCADLGNGRLCAGVVSGTSIVTVTFTKTGGSTIQARMGYQGQQNAEVGPWHFQSPQSSYTEVFEANTGGGCINAYMEVSTQGLFQVPLTCP
ncbi:MAG TPA: hypothetical protein VNO31_05345 [Umezawaea sp.]|nr:hypothetical protein [Umezawaea sp.]